MSDELREYLASNKRESYAFRNEPVRLPEDDLKRIHEDLHREASRWPEIQTVAVDQTRVKGGVLEVRLLACYDSNLIDEASHDFREVVKIIGTRNVLAESCLCLDEETYPSLQKIDPLLEPEYLFGKRYEIRSIKHDEIRFYYISRLMDLLCTGYLKPFYRWEVQREVDTRQALVELQRFARFIDLVKVIMRKQGKWEPDRHAARLRWLVENWFELGLPRYQYLMEAIRESFVLVHEFIAELDAYFQKARVVNMKTEESAQDPLALLAAERHTTAFVRDWSALESLRVVQDMLSKQETFLTVLPASFAVQLCEYTRGSEVFHRYVRSCFKNDGVSGNLERSYICWERGNLLGIVQALDARLNGSEAGKDLVFGCNLKSGMTMAKAANAMNIHRNKQNLKRMFRLYRGEDVSDLGLDAAESEDEPWRATARN